jgi:excisionase family DNA binding protein
MNSTKFFPRVGSWHHGASGARTESLRLYRLKELAALTGLSVRKLRGLIKDGHLRGTKIPGSAMRVSAADLGEFLAQNKTRTIL